MDTVVYGFVARCWVLSAECWVLVLGAECWCQVLVLGARCTPKRSAPHPAL